MCDCLLDIGDADLVLRAHCHGDALAVRGRFYVAHDAAARRDRLRETGGFRIEPKQAWTPVAQFTEEGMEAVNLGPGATEYAHKRDERVSILELVRTSEALQRFITGRVPR